MALLQKDLFNSPYSGVFCATNDSLTLIPPGIPEDDMEANTAIVRVLKSRYTGYTGYACSLLYDGDTGRLTELTDEVTFENEDIQF